MTGYGHLRYVATFAEVGLPLELTRSQGWLLQRTIPGFPYHDAMGCYPLFTCQDWDRLADDLEQLRHDLVSVVLVTDPFGNYDALTLERVFPDMCRPFKQHFVVDLHRSPDSFVSAHHRRNVRRAASLVEVELCPDPSAYSTEWISLYGNLIARHHIGGISAFSPVSLADQLRVPGLVMLRAVHGQETIGITLWYVQGPVAYYHLAAYSDLGYELRASFSLFDFAIRYFAQRVDWLNLGAGAGTDSSRSDGLTRFKSGWANGMRTAHLCGRILDAGRYHELAQASLSIASKYFPAYRCNEFRSRSDGMSHPS